MDADDDPIPDFIPEEIPDFIPEEIPDFIPEEDYPEAVFDFTFHVDTLWSNAGDSMVIAVNNAATMISAVNTVNSLGDGRYIIALAADIVLPASDAPALRFTQGDTTILGCGHTLQLQPTDGGESPVLVEGENTVLTLSSGSIEDSLVLRGMTPVEDEDYPSLITVQGGSLCLCDGAVIENHQAGHGGGAILAVGGSVVLYGGTIRGCGVVGYGDVYGGAAAVTDGADFCMYDGLIEDCRALSLDGVGYGGGIAVCQTDDSTVTFSGGMIRGCYASCGGAVFCGASRVTLLGSVSVEDNFAFGEDGMDSGGGVWFEPDDSSILYVYDACVIRDNHFFGSDSCFLAPSAADGPEASGASELTRGSAVLTVTDDALGLPSDLCGAEIDTVLLIGDLSEEAYISVGGRVIERTEPASAVIREEASQIVEFESPTPAASVARVTA